MQKKSSAWQDYTSINLHPHVNHDILCFVSPGHRTSLQGRNTKVAVVLIQKKTPLPPGMAKLHYMYMFSVLEVIYIMQLFFKFSFLILACKYISHIFCSIMTRLFQ